MGIVAPGVTIVRRKTGTLLPARLDSVPMSVMSSKGDVARFSLEDSAAFPVDDALHGVEGEGFP